MTAPDPLDVDAVILWAAEDATRDDAIDRLAPLWEQLGVAYERLTGAYVGLSRHARLDLSASEVRQAAALLVAMFSTVAELRAIAEDLEDGTATRYADALRVLQGPTLGGYRRHQEAA